MQRHAFHLLLTPSTTWTAQHPKVMAAQLPPTTTSDNDGSYYDLGQYHRTVTATKKEAQTWFNRGLIWCYAFHHEEAVTCFEKAIAIDADCPLAYWGLAYALGPNYNKPWEFFEGQELDSTVERTHRAAREATQRSHAASPAEISIIQALRHRYPLEHLSDASSENPPDWAIWNKEYADAMAKAYQSHPDDLDVTALYVDALMNLSPWKLWDLRTGEPAPGACTLEAKKVLEAAFVRPGGSSHPGLLHLWIHLMEMSSHPEDALKMADNLRELVPDAGHLNHMPSHLDILCGHYKNAVDANTAAIRADEKYVQRAGKMNFYTLYRSHDYHFRIYAAMFSAQSKIAIETAVQLEKSIPEDLLRIESPPMADWLEGFLSMRYHAYVRFGRWEDIIALPYPADPELYCATTASLHYVKGLAFAALGRIEEAEQEKTKFQDAVELVPESRTVFNNTCVAILKVAGAMLDGEIEYRRGNYELAFEHLRWSTDLYDNLPYDEPWGFMQPTRHALSALLLEQGHVQEAAALYRADLGLDATLPRAHQHPNNVWALHGYHECLLKLGQLDEARLIEPKLKKALEIADVPIKSSCFCRLKL